MFLGARYLCVKPWVFNQGRSMKKLSQEWINYLAVHPESGMGFQRVDVKFEDGSRAEDCSVVNSEQIMLPDDCNTKVITSIIFRKEEE